MNIQEEIRNVHHLPPRRKGKLLLRANCSYFKRGWYRVEENLMDIEKQRGFR